MKTITFNVESAQETFETTYRTVTASVNARHGYIGIDLQDIAGGRQESITLTVQEMEQLIAFYKKNVEVK